MEKRLSKRGTESSQKISERLKIARYEIEKAKEEKLFVVINKELEACYTQIRQALTPYLVESNDLRSTDQKRKKKASSSAIVLWMQKILSKIK